ELAKRELEQQISHIGKIEKYVDRPDLARLYALKTTTQRALDSIQKNGLGHVQTLRHYQTLIIRYRHSLSFLSEIITDETKESVEEVLRITNSIAKTKGFDDSPYTRIT